jgi:hypothetical protein
MLNYVKKLASVMIDDVSTTHSKSALAACFTDANSIDAAKRFISDHQVTVLVLERLPMARGGQMSFLQIK